MPTDDLDFPWTDAEGRMVVPEPGREIPGAAWPGGSPCFQWQDRETPDHIVHHNVFDHGTIADLLCMATEDQVLVPYDHPATIHAMRLMVDTNLDCWNVDVRGMYQQPQVLTYDSANKQPSHDLHTDYGPTDRSKLAITVMLANSTDVGIEFCHGGDVSLDIGDAVIFPGWVAHRVPPISGKGYRTTFVAWLGGPPWS